MRLFISSDLPNFSPAGPAEQSSLQQTTANVATKFNFTDMVTINQ
jgi:hypothetical protein